MLRRACWLMLLLPIAATLSAQQIYWKKDHLYNGPGGKEIATVAPAPSDQTAPSAPTGLSYSSLTATSVQLNWSASTDSGGSGIAGYKIYRQLASNAAAPVGTVGSGTLSFVDQPLTPSTGYTYSIRAFDGAQNHSGPSNSVALTTSSSAGDSTGPTTPLNLQGRALAHNQARLDWRASTDAGGSGLAGYKVYRDSVLVSGASPIAAVSFTDTGLTANTTYAYTVTAVDGNGNASTPTAAVNVTTPLELLVKDDFNRPDSSSLGSPWTGSPFVVSALKARCDLTNSCRTWFPNTSVGSFRATYAVTSGMAGITFWGPMNEYSSYFRVRSGAGSVMLEYYAYECCGLSQWYTLDYVNASGPIKVETTSSTGTIKVWVNNQLQMNYTDTFGAAHSGYAGIYGSATAYYGAGILDDLILHRLP